VVFILLTIKTFVAFKMKLPPWVGFVLIKNLSRYKLMKNKFRKSFIFILLNQYQCMKGIMVTYLCWS